MVLFPGSTSGNDQSKLLLSEPETVLTVVVQGLPDQKAEPAKTMHRPSRKRRAAQPEAQVSQIVEIVGIAARAIRCGRFFTGTFFDLADSTMLSGRSISILFRKCVQRPSQTFK